MCHEVSHPHFGVSIQAKTLPAAPVNADIWSHSEIDSLSKAHWNVCAENAQYKFITSTIMATTVASQLYRTTTAACTWGSCLNTRRNRWTKAQRSQLLEPRRLQSGKKKYSLDEQVSHSRHQLDKDELFYIRRGSRFWPQRAKISTTKAMNTRASYLRRIRPFRARLRDFIAQPTDNQ